MTNEQAAQLKMWDTIWVRHGTITREDVVMATEKYENGEYLIETRTCGWVGPSRVVRRTDEGKPGEDTWSDDTPDTDTSGGSPFGVPSNR
jgi:hypothetical protein